MPRFCTTNFPVCDTRTFGSSEKPQLTERATGQNRLIRYKKTLKKINHPKCRNPPRCGVMYI